MVWKSFSRLPSRATWNDTFAAFSPPSSLPFQCPSWAEESSTAANATAARLTRPP